MDGMVAGRQRHDLEEHLGSCGACERQYTLLRQTQRMLSGLGPKPVPDDLALQLRVAISREMANARRVPWEGWQIRWQNAIRAFMVPATAGALSAVVFFGFIIGFFAVPQPLQALDNDVPTALYTAPELKFSPFEIGMGSINTESVVVEVKIDTAGRVTGYHVISAPGDAQQYRPDLENLLIFTVFRPATAFGQPTEGKAVLSFSAVNVKG
jgi:hypothetical protein